MRLPSAFGAARSKTSSTTLRRALMHKAMLGTLLGTLLGTMLSVPVGRAVAQSATVSGPAMTVDAQLRARLISAMERDLKALVAAQQAYLAAQNEFASHFERGAIKGVKLSPSPGVTVTLTYVTKQTFAARATHDWLPGRSCVVKVGSVAASRVPTTTNEKKLPTRDGISVCDTK